MKRSSDRDFDYDVIFGGSGDCVSRHAREVLGYIESLYQDAAQRAANAAIEEAMRIWGKDRPHIH